MSWCGKIFLIKNGGKRMIRGLFCGVSEYRANQELSYCVNDAKKMKETFIDTFVCSDNSIEILAENGSIENLEYIKKVKEFSEKCSEDDIAVIYYSGHGGIDDDGSNYLYATNTFDGNNTTYIYFDVIIEWLKKAKAKSKLIIIDCCHADSDYGLEQQKFDTDKAITDIYQAGIISIFSCRKDQESYPYSDNKISAFTQFFCDAIKYKRSYQPEGLYFSDLKISLDAYARAWNIRNSSKQQMPVMRSNMIGTIVFPLKHPPEKSERETIRIVFDTFDALNFEWQVKKPREIEYYQKVYRTNIVAKIDIDEENIVTFSSQVLDKLRSLKLQPKTQKQSLTQARSVDVIQLWIAKDYLDVGDEGNNFAYQVYWEKDDNLYWCKQLGDERIQIGNMAYKKNTDYERQRKYREKYILPDDVIMGFWEAKLRKLICETNIVIRMYSNLYLNQELSYDDLKAEAKNMYDKLKNEYDDVFNSWWPLPDSNLKDYAKQSFDLAIDIQELLYLLQSDKGEKWVMDNFGLKLRQYYKSVEKWKRTKKEL